MENPNFRIVLVEPEIPNNTGNIGRSCVGTNCELHLIKPLGFSLDDKYLKRAGLDYWPHLSLTIHESLDMWLAEVEETSRVWFFTTKAEKSIYSASLQKGDWLVFGKETKGLGEDLLTRHSEQNLTLPILGPIRSLNLANSVVVAAYEGLRQISAFNKPCTSS